MNYLGVSGSTIFSDAKKFAQLFDYKLEHIEIGEFKNKKQLKRFARMLSHSLCTLGIHSPFLRNKSKYDLIEHVDYSPAQAFINLNSDAKKAKYLGAKYLLVHFPYFDDKVPDNANAIIEDGLIALKKLQDLHEIEIVCEPKLGAGRATDGIKHFNNFPIEIWRKYNLKVCIDVGDYVMAYGEKNMLDPIIKWQDFIRVVHLHNVGYPNGGYVWRPMHPDDAKKGYHNLADTMAFLNTLHEVYFVLEHTPEEDYTTEYLKQSTEYIKNLLF